MRFINYFLRALAALLVATALSSCSATDPDPFQQPSEPTPLLATNGSGTVANTDVTTSADTDLYPVLQLDSNLAYTEVNSNQPYFTDTDYETAPATEQYASLDALGRVGCAFVLVSQDTMPAIAEERGDISNVYPSGWCQAEYDFVDQGWLYNRCHLIGWQLTAENDNAQNLMCGTRFLNTQGMLPFENTVAEHVHTTAHAVLYRVTPVFEGDNLLASGVYLEADCTNCDNCRFCVWCPNVQPGVIIDYATGENCAAETASETVVDTVVESEVETDANLVLDNVLETVAAYVLNTNSHKVHLPSCDSVAEMAEHNRQDVETTLAELVADGYEPCARCLG